MKISYESLIFESEATGFRPEILEKVVYLIHLLNRFAEDAYLKNRFVLKGGTALNLFYFDYPRLSVDIDINYIGSAERSILLQEKADMESTIENILLDEGLKLQRKPDEHAGGKWSIRYPSALQGQGIIEIDLNYLDRVPLWPIKHLHSFKLGSFEARNVPVQDIHELAAGKLRALFSRHSSRDLFDTHQLLTNPHIDIDKLRLGFILYGAASRKDWRHIQVSDIHFDWREFQKMLIPLLRKADLLNRENPKKWAENIMNESQVAAEKLLPLKKHELEFLNKLLMQGEIDIALLTEDESLQANVLANPALLWKASHVKQFFQKG